MKNNFKKEPIELGLSPLLRELLGKYINLTYEDNADLSEEALEAEFRYLDDHGQLRKLFETETYLNTYHTVNCIETEAEQAAAKKILDNISAHSHEEVEEARRIWAKYFSTAK